MAIQMISDLPVFQVTKDTPVQNIMGSFMEISYLSSSVNLGDQQTRYKSMAIPLGMLYKAIMMSNSSETGSIYTFPEECTFIDGFSLSGDVFLNRDVSDNQNTLSVSMGQVYLFSPVTEISSINGTLYSKNFEMVNFDDNSSIFQQLNKNFEFKSGTTVNFNGTATCQDANGSNGIEIVNYNTLREAFKKYTGISGLLFELRQLDYQDDSLSSIGWVRLNSNSWLLSSQFPETFNHLSLDWNRQQNLSTDTYSNVSIQYKRAGDGHKIISYTKESQETDRMNVVNETGCFWYYTIDIQNKRFKLPLTKVQMQPIGITDEIQVGNYVKPSLPIPPPHKHSFSGVAIESKNGYQETTTQISLPKGSTGNTNYSQATDWNDTNSIYSKDTNTVQPPAVLMETYMRCV